MRITVRPLFLEPLHDLDRRLHNDPIVLKFIALQASEDEVIAVMGWTSQHCCLALAHHLNYDLDQLRAWFEESLPFKRTWYPVEVHRYTYVGAGFISPCIRNLVHVPTGDRIEPWHSTSLSVKTTPEWRTRLEPALLARVTDLVEPDLIQARHLRDHPTGDF